MSKGFAGLLILLLIVTALAVAGYWAYQNYYQQSVENINRTISIDPGQINTGGDNQKVATISGYIQSNFDQCLFDQACYVTVRALDKNWKVIYKYGKDEICKNPETVRSNELFLNTKAQAYGKVTEENTINLCGSPDFFIDEAK